MKNTSNDFIHDYVSLLQELADQAKSADGNPNDFDAGRAFGLYEALSLVEDQLMAFGIALADVGLESLDPEQYLVRGREKGNM